MVRLIALAVLACCYAFAAASGEDANRAAAREDLAQRLKVSPERVEVVSEHQMVWRDSNMGCVRVEVAVENIITRGTELVLFAKGQKYYYHARQGEPYHYCALPSSKRTGPVEAPMQ